MRDYASESLSRGGLLTTLRPQATTHSIKTCSTHHLTKNKKHKKNVRDYSHQAITAPLHYGFLLYNFRKINIFDEESRHESK